MSFLKKHDKYGLVIPKGSSKIGSGQLGKVASIFKDDSSEEDEKKKKQAINRELNVVAEHRKQTHQTRKDIQKALEEDPSVYQYDEIYDELEQKKIVATQATKTKDKKPRYIANLLKSAEVRKKEQERRAERSVQKEREKEGDEFADKESFVTSAYRQKMIDQAEEEENLRKQDQADAKHDVRKQKDLSQFYRNILDNNVAMGASQDQPETSEKEIKGNKEDGETKFERDVKQEILSESDDEEMHSGKKGQESPSKGKRREGRRREGQRREGQTSGSRSPVRGKGSSKVKEDDTRSKTMEFTRNEGKKRQRHDTSTESSDSETEKKYLERRSKKLEGSERNTKQGDSRLANEENEGREGYKKKEGQRKVEKLRQDASSSDSEADTVIRKHHSRTNKMKAGKRGERSEDSNDEYSKKLPRHSTKEKLKSRKESKGRHYRRQESSTEESDSSSDRKKGSKGMDERSKGSVRNEKTEDVRQGRGVQSDVARHRSKDREVSRKQRERPVEDGADHIQSKERNRRSISSNDITSKRSQRENRRSRDRKRSRDREDSRSFENKENESDSSEENNARPSSKEKQLKREEVTEKQEKRSVFAKRNDEQSIIAARERYLARKRARIVPETFDEDSD